jgi:hypothetical protein
MAVRNTGKSQLCGNLVRRNARQFWGFYPGGLYIFHILYLYSLVDRYQDLRQYSGIWFNHQ